MFYIQKLCSMKKTMFYEKLCSIFKNSVLCSKNLKKKKWVKRKKKTTFLEEVSFTDLIDARTKNFSLVSLQGIACSIPRDVSKSKKFCSVKQKIFSSVQTKPRPHIRGEKF